jgi:hypothetical protein
VGIGGEPLSRDSAVVQPPGQVNRTVTGDTDPAARTAVVGDVAAPRRLTARERWRALISGSVPVTSATENTTVVDRGVPPGAMVEDREVVEADDNRRGRAAAIIGGMVLGGLLVWVGTKIGPDHAEEVKNYFKGQTGLLQQKLNTANAHINDLRGQIKSHGLADAKRFDTLVHRQNHDLRLDQRALHLLRALNRHEAREGTGGAGANMSAHVEHLRYYGDTIWDHAKRLVERRTGRSHDWGQVRKVTAKILHMNGLQWNSGGWGVDAHKLPIGLGFKVPNKIT